MNRIMDRKKQFSFQLDDEIRKMLDALMDRGCNIAKLIRYTIRNEYKKLVDSDEKK